MPNLPATMACPVCGNRDTETLTWCGEHLDCDCGERFDVDPWCGACNGLGYIDREYTDWVPYGSGNVPMPSVNREECECAGHCPMCGAVAGLAWWPEAQRLKVANEGPCPVCGYVVNWEGPDNFVTGGDEC